MKQGWIKLHRELLNSSIWNKPSDWLKVWIYLLLTVDKNTGEGFYTYEQIEAVCRLKKGVVKRALLASRRDTRIETAQSPRGVRVKVLQYAEFQDSENLKSPARDSRASRKEPARVPAINKQEEEVRIRNTNPSVVSPSGEPTKKVSDFSSIPESSQPHTPSFARPPFPKESEAYRLSELLLEQILQNNPNHKRPNLQSWAVDADKMLRLDNRPFDEAEAVIYWATQDSFWKANILSTKTLREKYDQLVIKAKSNFEASKPKFMVIS